MNFLAKGNCLTILPLAEKIPEGINVLYFFVFFHHDILKKGEKILSRKV
ncbi:hypothetical protein SMITH_634 [Smithella sp. ME-1]|uniref:Uncharacterized protein n=1 Tax=hydrocarbon metagenome TaxID=938273 RepID=A0A0W8FP79_9ZZZZ|nr:hypothetical protein SMITH_634 [Smithella sp. ME-1]